MNDFSSMWSKYIDLDWENEGISGFGSSKVGNIEVVDLLLCFLVFIFCIVYERRFISRGIFIL